LRKKRSELNKFLVGLV